MKRLIKQNLDGTVSIIIPAPNAVKELGLGSYDELLDHIENQESNVVARINATEVPDDSAELEWVVEAGKPVQKPCANPRAFRGAWVWDGAAVVTDPAKKLEHKKAQTRKVRDDLLQKSDVDYTVAVERGLGEVQQLKQYRQSLRDLGAAIDADPDNITFPTKP